MIHILYIMATISIQKDNKEQVFLVVDSSLKSLVKINLWLSFHLSPIAPQPVPAGGCPSLSLILPDFSSC